MPVDLSKIHPQLQQAAKNYPSVKFTKSNLWLVRFLIGLTPAPKPSTNIAIKNIHIPVTDERRNIRVRLYRPAGTQEPTPLFLWLHGGGYLAGKPEMDDTLCAAYVHNTSVTVASVDYRLAPNHPFPAGLDDCYKALLWLTQNAASLNIDPKRIAVGGASAGGGLAAALAQMAHDRQEIRLALQLLVYPMIDDRTVLRPEADDSNAITWNQASNRFGWESYLGAKCGEDSAPEYAVPARRANLSGLAPAWLGVGSVDLFHDEDVEYAKRLQSSGVPCELIVVPGAFHGFNVFDHQIPIVQEFHASQFAALKKHLFA